MAFDWNSARRVGDLAGKSKQEQPMPEEQVEMMISPEEVQGTEHIPQDMAISAEQGLVEDPMLPEKENAQYKKSTEVADIIRDVIGEEGGYSNNPRDKGGPTKYGIALNMNKDALEEIGVEPTAEGVKNLTFEQAVQIYETEYWQKSGAEDLPEDVRFDYFTAYINSPRRAVRAVQEAVGTKTDGIMGEKTKSAVADKVAEMGAEELGRAIKKEYVMSLVGSPDWDEFGNGWANRYLETNVFGTDKIDLNTMSKAQANKEMNKVFGASDEKSKLNEVELALNEG